MGACSGRSLQVSFEHGRALAGGDFFQPNFFTATMSEHGLPVGGPDIPDPSRILAQHRYKASLTVHFHHHQGKRYPPAGPTARHLECNEVVACDAEGKDNGRSAVQDLCKSVGPSAPVHPAGKIAGVHRVLLFAQVADLGASTSVPRTLHQQPLRGIVEVGIRKRPGKHPVPLSP
jgi:hypothetical protein